MALALGNQLFTIGIDIGGLCIAVRSSTAEFIRILERRYAGFTHSPEWARAELEVEIGLPSGTTSDDELEVRRVDDVWVMRRGDFLARWDPRMRRGAVRCVLSPYGIDAVLRIVHSLVLAEEFDGFLLHSASTIRNGHALLFSGVSGSGKTTLTRLAPSDAILLSDEISYVRRSGTGYRAFGTPFVGELGIAGASVSAPLAAVYFLEQAQENRVCPIPPVVAARKLLRNLLFFAGEEALVERVFGLGCEFVSVVPAFELAFRPEPAVWELLV
jgi:hypothetical protein